ncbi:unnamed protein product, partial [Amoebophrya sp. A120]
MNRNELRGEFLSPTFGETLLEKQELSKKSFHATAPPSHSLDDIRRLSSESPMAALERKRTEPAMHTALEDSMLRAQGLYATAWAQAAFTLEQTSYAMIEKGLARDG